MPGMSETGTLYLGTSGFAYPEWKHDVFYPEGLKNREMLSYYSSQLTSVEINYTFRRFPTEKTLTTWREQAQEGFVFTLKANQRITHYRRLRDADEDVRDFLERARLLGDRLGCVLFQLLTGDVPYTGPAEQMFYGHVMAPIPSVVERSRGRLPAAAQEVLERALAKRPADRFRSAGELARAFEALSDGETTARGPAVPANVADPGRRPSRSDLYLFHPLPYRSLLHGASTHPHRKAARLHAH